MEISNRRSFLWTIAASGIASAGLTAAVVPTQSETVYRFVTPECEGQMSVQFHDRYSSQGFWFDDRLSDHKFCLSARGEEGLNCLPKFFGSIAIAVYHFRPHPHAPKFVKVRERVRTIDQDGRMNARPPFEATLPLQRETASDIQAFGYDADDPARPALGAKELDPWCLLRQDLYLDDQSSPFLIVHWKHTLNAITLVDVIPGDQTQLSRG